METDKNEDEEKKKKKGKVFLCSHSQRWQEACGVWTPFMWCKKEKKKALQFLFFPSAPKCGFIKGNEKIMLLLERVKPEIVALRETIIVVSEKLPLQICKDDPDSAPKTLN